GAGGGIEPVRRKRLTALRRHRGPFRSVCRAREAIHRTPWWHVWGGMGLLSGVLWGATGCIEVLSDQVRQQADQTVTFAQVHAKPEAYSGRTVILGGEIVRVWNVPGATWFD